ncbi:MAG: hypothetical protein ACI867_000061 [Glaciecola sp.]|jgi:hypothetical protein
MLRTPSDELWQEMAYLAYHLHWPMDDLLDLSHRDRVRLILMVSGIDSQSAGRRQR